MKTHKNSILSLAAAPKPIFKVTFEGLGNGNKISKKEERKMLKPKTNKARILVMLIACIAIVMAGYHMYCHYMVASFFTYLDEKDTEGALKHIEKMPDVNMRDSCYLIYRIKDIFTQGDVKGYPLDWAVYRDADISIFEALLKKGANPNQTNLTNATTFQYANAHLVKNKEKKIMLMIEYGADVKSITFGIYASDKFDSKEAEERYFDYIVYLWENGAREWYNVGTRVEATVLHEAVKYLDADHLDKLYHNEKRSMAYLLDEQDANGETPIFYAVRRNSYEICDFLIKEGADLTIKNNEGKTVFEVAEELDHKGCLRNALSD